MDMIEQILREVNQQHIFEADETEGVMVGFYVSGYLSGKYYRSPFSVLVPGS
jgi:hypothetical protein